MHDDNNIQAKSRDYKEGPLYSRKGKVLSSCPKQKHFPPVLVTIFNISGGNEHAIFVMGAMFLASALNRVSHPPEILKMPTNSGGKCFGLGHWLGKWCP